RQAHVDRGFGVAVERPALVVRSRQAETVEHLDLGIVNVDSTVAATLPACLRLERGAKLQVQLADAEALLAAGPPAEEVVLDQLAVLPLVGAGAIEEHDGPLRRLFPQRWTLPLDVSQVAQPAQNTARLVTRGVRSNTLARLEVSAGAG